jgi:ribonuclease T2
LERPQSMAFRPASRNVAIAGFVALCLAGLANGVAAQAGVQNNGCVLDNCADRKPPSASVAQAAPGAPQSRPNVPGDFDFYVLALSWSPGFCDTGGAGKAHAQCASGAHLGFVVHGLWPQDQHGYPLDCGGISSPSHLALQTVQGLYPDEGLARFEWRKHGTCSGKGPTDYFADVRKARAAIVIPPPFRDAQHVQAWTPLDIQRAFIAANPRLRPGMLAVECNEGELEEVRICFSRDLHDFVACPEVSRHFCYTQQVTVSPMR